MSSPLPPGQIETRRFPVVGERVPSTHLIDPSQWSLEIAGLVERPFAIGLEAFLDRANVGLVADIHCVTSWSRLAMNWTGLPLRVLLEEAGLEPGAAFVSFESYSERDHHTSLSLEVALASSWLIHSADGQPLSVDHGGPVRVFTEGRYFYKSLKWVKRVVVLEEDRPGWWETDSNYHNNADPLPGDERFTTGSIRPEQLDRFLNAMTYEKYRGRVMVGLDLRSWSPQTRDLQRLYLKNCNLSGIDLAGADMRESNLSLSDLRGAKLRGADLSGSDLEGTNFAGADLRDADLSGTALSATRFQEQDRGADLTGARFDGSWGLTESQEDYLASST
ncbi:MAG: molybdopterin-dependent oxidoreductase [Actinomycetota bacterium]|nr:molybdopterin-dependent oxidoreductase [Actinomycetota bacterium]